LLALLRRPVCRSLLNYLFLNYSVIIELFVLLNYLDFCPRISGEGLGRWVPLQDVLESVLPALLRRPIWGVEGSGFRVQGSGFRVQGSGFRVQGSGFRVDV